MDQIIIERAAIGERLGEDDESPDDVHEQAVTERLPLESWLIIAILLASYANALWHLLG